MAISLVSNHEMRLSGIGEVTWGMSLSDIRAKIDSAVPDNAQITKITLNFSGKSYNNNIFGALNEYVHCALTNSDSEAASNNTGGSGNCTNLFKYGPYEINGRSTTTLPNQSVDITKYFGAATPHNVQNTSYSRLTIAFTSKAVYNKDETFSLSLDVTYKTHSHSYTTETTRTASTCCKKGSVTKKCSCGATQTTELALDPNNHSGGTEIKNAVSATCTSAGYTGDTYCKGCGVKLSSGSAIAKLSHTEEIIPAVAPTCTETGLTAGKKCSVCNTVITAQQTVAALGHSYSSVVTKPTGDSPGYTTHTCGNCGHSYADNYVYLPKFTSVAMTYLGKQISATNKVPCGEGFIISVGVT